MHTNTNDGLRKIVDDLKNIIMGEGSFDDVA
jgi:hypothetical protein